MKRYEKPSLAVSRFTTQETIANSAYGYELSTGTVSNETYNGVEMPVTSYRITSLGASSNS